MSCGFLADGVRSVLGDGSGLGIRLRFVEEPEPRGTAGALKLAEPMLDERFLMLNGDVLTDIDLTAQIAQHEAQRRARDARAGPRRRPQRLRPGDPRARTARCSDFVEKPSSGQLESEPDQRRRVRARARDPRARGPPERNVSIEREVWPLLVGNGLYGFPSESYWLDIGTPAALPAGDLRHPRGQRRDAPCASGSASDWLAIDERAEVHGRVIPPALLERGVRVAAGRARRQPRGARRRTCRSARAATRRARGRARRGRRSARAASCATASSPPAVAWAPAPGSPAARCSARA